MQLLWTNSHVLPRWMSLNTCVDGITSNRPLSSILSMEVQRPSKSPGPDLRTIGCVFRNTKIEWGAAVLTVLGLLA
jgi:hypothetical protein